MGSALRRQHPFESVFPLLFFLSGVGYPDAGRHDDGMQPVDLTPIGTELAIKWDDGTESFVPLETLRRFCPCASCLGEKDIFGTTYKPPERPYGPHAFQLVRLAPVGGYGVQPAWADGHGTGIFSWDYLRQVAAAP